VNAAENDESSPLPGDSPKVVAAQGITRVGRSVVIKRALLEGLRVLEERYRPR